MRGQGRARRLLLACGARLRRSETVLGHPSHFDSYLVWEEGTPDVAFEVLSPSDTPERWTFEEKLRRHGALGVRELITFHVDGEPGQRLRVWDRIEHDLIERVVTGDMTPCLTLA